MFGLSATKFEMDALDSKTKQEIHQAVKKLYYHKNVPITSIDSKKPELKQSYEYLQNKYFKGSLEIRDYIVKVIKQWHRPLDIKPLTYSAFLFGYFQNDYGALDRNTSILGYHAIGSNRTYNYQIWLYKSNKLINVHTGNSNKAQIYVDSDFTAFQPKDIDRLSKIDVYMFGLYKTRNSRHYAYDPVMVDYNISNNSNLTLNQLPVAEDESETFFDEFPRQLKRLKDDNRFWIALAIIFIILLIVIYFKYDD